MGLGKHAAKQTIRMVSPDYAVGKLSQHDDSYIRKAAIKYKVPYITTITAALAAADGIASARKVRRSVKSLQQYHADIQAAPIISAK